MIKSRMAIWMAAVLGATSLAQAADYVPGEVIVKYKDNAPRSRAYSNNMYAAAGAEGVKRYRGIMHGFESIYLGSNVKVEDAIAELMRNDAVEFAQPNYIVRTLDSDMLAESAEAWSESAAPPAGGKNCWMPWAPGCGGNNPPGPGPTPTSGPGKPTLKPSPPETNPAVSDPDLGQAYGLEKIGATAAWGSLKGSKEIIVAGIDTGMDYNHEDLAFNMWRNPRPSSGDVVGFDFVHNDGMPYDDQGHGTHTAGTIGAVGGNGKGVSGVSQRVSLMALKFLSAQGSGTTANAIKSIDYAVTHGARILSNSWGGKADKGNKALFEAIERARAKGVLFVAAAGNNGEDNDNESTALYPAAFTNENMITVAATGASDELASFSNFGKTTVHVAAPGVKVYSTVPKDKYRAASGTSMACPHVAGAAALIWARNPSWNYKQVKSLLMKSVDPVAALEGKTVTGGRINVGKALKIAQAMNSRSRD